MPLPLVARYTAGVLLALFDCWLDRGMLESPEDIDAYFVQPGESGVRAATGSAISYSAANT